MAKHGAAATGLAKEIQNNRFIPVQIISRKFPFKSLNLFIHVLLFKKAVHISLLGQALIPRKINTVLTKEAEMPGLLLRAKASRVETGERH